MALSKTFAVGEVLTAQDVNEHLVNRVPSSGADYDTGWLDLEPSTGWRLGGVPGRCRRIGPLIITEGRMERESPVTIGTSFVEVGTFPLPPRTTTYVPVTTFRGDLQGAITGSGLLRVRRLESGTVELSADDYVSIACLNWTQD